MSFEESLISVSVKAFYKRSSHAITHKLVVLCFHVKAFYYKCDIILKLFTIARLFIDLIFSECPSKNIILEGIECFKLYEVKSSVSF